MGRALTLSTGLAAVGGGVCGLALARGLFEAQPLVFGLAATWPGALLALAGGGVVAVLAERRRAPGAPTLAALPLCLPLLGLVTTEVDPARAFVLVAGAVALSAFWLSGLGGGSTRRGVWAAGLALSAALTAVYALTLAPVVGEADPFEFQVNVARLGVAHGNGYPLLLLVGKAFEGLPLGGTQAWRVNASAAAAMVSAALGVWALARRYGAASWAAALAALAFGLAPSVWARAVEIEAYALNAALLTGLLLLAFVLLDPATEAAPRVLWALAFVFGLALTNHLTALMAAPALAWAAGVWLWRWRRAVPAGRWLSQGVLMPALFFGLGLAVYLYLPLRWPALNGGEALSLEQFIYFLRGGEAAGQFDPWLPFKEPQRFAYVARKIVAEFGGVGLALTAVGAAATLARPPRAAQGLPLILAYLGYGYFVLAYDPPEPDFSDFFIATYVIAAVWLAVGADRVAAGLRRLLPPAAGAAEVVTATGLAILPLAALWTGLPRFDYTQARARYAQGVYTLQQPLAPNAVVLADPKRFAAPYYLQAAEGIRPDLDIRVLPDEATYRAVLDEQIAAGTTVYLARYLPGLGSGYALRSVGPLAEVAPAPQLTPPALAQGPAVTLANGIQLAGHHLEAGPGLARLTLLWHAPATPEAHLAVYLRVRDAAGQVVWQNAGRVPVSGLYPTNAWRPGEYVSDYHEIALDPSWPPGAYTVQAGLFPPFAPEPDQGWATVAPLTVTVSAEPARPPRPVRARFGEQWLMGYAAPESALPGAALPVTLYWLRGADETVTAFGETRSLAGWPPGAVAPVRYLLPAPAEAEAVALEVQTGAAAVCGWLAAPGPGCGLPPVRLTGAALPAGAVNYNHELVLRSVALDRQTLAPGEALGVVLEWQGLRQMTTSYTVFVHLVGPDGRLYGQRDYWPVEGTRLTPTWTPGEIIRDPYQVVLNPDAPPGAYTVHIGLYQLETLERLPVLNAEGEPLDDKVVKSGVVVEE